MTDVPAFVAMLERKDDPKLFRGLPVGNFWLSIQGHKGAYSCPRETHADPRVYTAWEVLLTNEHGYVDVRNDPRFKDGPWVEFWEESEYGIGGYVPSHVVQALYDRCKELEK